MKKYNRNNFFKHTYCEWTEIPIAFIEGKEPNYKSKAGSSYYFDEDGVARYSNHWGRAANCRWKLVAKEKKNSVYCLAYARWDSFYPNNELEPFFVICYDEVEKNVDFKHRDALNDSKAIARNAKETNARIKKINEILTTDDWFKYIDCESIEATRSLFVNELVYSDKKYNTIRQNLLNNAK